ncbi:MAG: type III secretion chaperone SycN [Desulfovibrio piger]|uniref:Type III secretion chaperone SycN n=1 Tax=Desulfovibrio piger ATCC 29098 TaxID=411464 RepID=B6WRJ7_9BACT|nr:type III secretion chaperone SycN [Desulfovibrio piger]EEB34415.1 type III secretion chaperone SycN [Desulfovibrio piger ATCC 29098]OLA83533.1 MAG: type III secretion chaperone SycN [Desulfovibrio piger]HCZ43929.1 type III secretion chaperone SycN [Desulfovibrio piger]
MLNHELNTFGLRMGLPGLAFSPQGLVALDVSGMGRLYFEKQQRHGEEELLVYLARPFPPHDSTLPERALALCHYRHARAFSLTAGMKGDNLILLTRLPERQATAALLEEAVMELARVMNHLQGA